VLEYKELMLRQLLRPHKRNCNFKCKTEAQAVASKGQSQLHKETNDE
jgi:hypothetical protein